MNSDDIIRRLNRLLNDKQLAGRTRAEVWQIIRHVKKQDEEMAKLRNDVTQVEFEPD
jgi:hypothetical protein